MKINDKGIKIIKNLPFLVLVVLALVACNNHKQEKSNDIKPYDGSWASLQKMPVPDWFDDGKIGIFIHWGSYSVIGHGKGGRGYAEHVPKMMYEDPEYYYPYVEERWGAKPLEFG
ncbi:alpha-L-fucosidase [Saccharicrinis sp. GN24d3]|uniref:alpha-L-fucosidase n=1 Tax=Saccharicrinis sp. GN24d3 TaxID=3458416 RepID=UPI0040373F87